MHVLATAGHVDHGKSTLVRALTGMEPDRWAEERRRGMTIDLGFAWTTTPKGATVAFVDVPGHERFVPNMLAGVGPVPAALVVVAADEGWMPQSAEHLAALNALDVRHGLLVITRSDLAAPEAATAQARAQLAGTTLSGAEAVPVSAPTGEGMDHLKAAIDRLVGKLPTPDGEAPVRLWIDRAFTIKGAGTVVTGTLGAGVVRVGDELQLGSETVRVRGLQTLGEARTEVAAVSRIAINLRGTEKDRAARGNALLTPGRFRLTDLIDVRIHGDATKDLPATLTLHIGSAAVPARIRPLGHDTHRLRLSHPLPLRLGDRALLRDPGRRHIAGGVTVLDVAPPGLSRRGAAAARAADLAGETGLPSLTAELRRRLIVKRDDLTTMGVPIDRAPVAGQWFADPGHWAALAERLPQEVARHKSEHPLEPGIPLEALRHRMELPDRALVEALVKPPLAIRSGRVTTAAPQGIPPELTQAIDRAFAGEGPFTAPEAYDLAGHGLGARQLAAAVRAGLLVQLAPAVVLRAGAPERAAKELRKISQPFTLSEARKALDTTRRVAVPLLEFLDKRGLTTRQEDDRRIISPNADPP